MSTKQNNNLRALQAISKVSYKDQLRTALLKQHPWDSIVDFAQHKDFCGWDTLFPRQKTLLKLMFLETENMTAYDIEVIDEWANGFTGGKNSYGVQPDIWQRVAYLKAKGYRRFPHIQAVLGRRASKGVMGGFLGAEAIAHMVSLDNPQNYYGIAKNKEIYLSVIATQENQAIKFQFADIREIATGCMYLQPYIANNRETGLTFRTPQDNRRIQQLYTAGVPMNKEISSIKCEPLSSNSASGRGGAGFALFLDEFAHMLETEGTRSSTAVYNASKPSLDQFGKDQLLYVASSPFTKVGMFFELYNQGSVYMDEFLRNNPQFGSTDRDKAFEDLTSVADPTKLIVQLASWDLYKDWERSGTAYVPGPKFNKAVIEYSDEMKVEEMQNPQAFKVERRGQFAEVIDGYLDPIMVDAMFLPFRGQKLTPTPFGQMRHDYHAHLDPGRTNANFALTIAHAEYDPAEKDRFGNLIPHVVVDYMKVWKPEDGLDPNTGEPNHTIDYELVKNDIIEITKKFPPLKTLTFDQWNSASFIAFFTKYFQGKIMVAEETANEAVNQQRYDIFKMAINQRMIHSYADKFNSSKSRGGECLLEQELKFLQEKNGRVIKQDIGPITTKDLSDCVVIVSNRILGDYFSSYSRSLLSDITPVATNLGEAARTGMGSSFNTRPQDAISKLNALSNGRSLTNGSTNRLMGRR